MSAKVAVDFIDAAQLVRWRALKADLSDQLLREVERAGVLTEHLAARLDAVSAGVEHRELPALSLVAESIRQRLTLIVERAQALLEAGGEA